MKRKLKAGDKSAPRNGKRDSNNLVALGSAAVLAIYGAGYVRTKPAADRFATESNDRRPIAQSAAIAPRTSSAGALRADSNGNVDIASTSLSRPADAASAAVGATPASMTPSATSPAASATAKTATAAVASASDRSAHPSTKQAGQASTKSSVAAVAPSESATSTSSTTSPLSTAPPPIPATSTTDSATAQGAAQDADSAAAKVTWRDGVYFGWGTSRHGDIEAKVEIKEGRIVSAEISQCLTRYSCSWISHLPPQVLTRQSAEVDYVSGATQSSNAFYYAVLGALNRAK